MFLTYLGRELRRRARQASMIAIGLALGIGLVITVTALSAGVKNAQGQVLHSLYGVGTDITVTKTPTASLPAPRFGFRGAFGNRARGKARDQDRRGQPGQRVARQDQHDLGHHDLAAAQRRGGGGRPDPDRHQDQRQDPVLRLLRRRAAAGSAAAVAAAAAGAAPSAGSSRRASITVSGVDLSEGALGPLSSGKLTSGRTFTAADASANDAILDSSYATANKLKVGSTVTIAKTSFKVVGIVSVPAWDSSLGRLHPAGPRPGPGQPEERQ